MNLIKSQTELQKMYRAGQLAARTLQYVGQLVQPGRSTQFLNDKAHAYILSWGAYPSPLNYRGFPKSICTSRNEVICHGIPSANEILEEGDIVNIDVTVTLEGYHGDTSKTYCVGGETPPMRNKVRQVSAESLARGIAQARPEGRIGDIGHAIQSYAEAQGCGVVRAFVGHGLGKAFHEDPAVPHYGRPNRGLKLRRGMCFTIEPMINGGSPHHRLLEDQWTALTEDGAPSAQYEHSLALVREGCVLLTALKEDDILKRAQEIGAPIERELQEEIFEIGQEFA